MIFNPLADRVLVERTVKSGMTESGIVIPDVAEEVSSEGTVVAVGPGSQYEGEAFIPTEVKVGDRVIFGKYSGVEINLDGEEYTMLRESELVAVIYPDE